jgi:Rod binding domain-containing protein
MTIGTPSVPLLSSSATVAGLKSSKTADAAQQFESLLLSQMLKAGRESAAILGGDDDDSESSTMLEVAEQQFAQILAKSGGVGLGRLITKGLESQPGKH